MNTKLTLTIEEDIIEKAKVYAKSEHRSLSDIIENYLKLLTSDLQGKNINDKSKSEITNSLRGSFKLPADLDYKKELNIRRDKKHLK